MAASVISQRGLPLILRVPGLAGRPAGLRISFICKRADALTGVDERQGHQGWVTSRPQIVTGMTWLAPPSPHDSAGARVAVPVAVVLGLCLVSG